MRRGPVRFGRLGMVCYVKEWHGFVWQASLVQERIGVVWSVLAGTVGLVGDGRVQAWLDKVWQAWIGSFRHGGAWLVMAWSGTAGNFKTRRKSWYINGIRRRGSKQTQM